MVTVAFYATAVPGPEEFLLENHEFMSLQYRGVPTPAFCLVPTAFSSRRRHHNPRKNQKPLVARRPHNQGPGILMGLAFSYAILLRNGAQQRLATTPSPC